MVFGRGRVRRCPEAFAPCPQHRGGACRQPSTLTGEGCVQVSACGAGPFSAAGPHPGCAGFSQAWRTKREEGSKGPNKQAVHFGDNGQPRLQAGKDLWNPRPGRPGAEAPVLGPGGCGALCARLMSWKIQLRFPGCEKSVKIASGAAESLSSRENPELISFVPRAQHILAEAWTGAGPPPRNTPSPTAFGETLNWARARGMMRLYFYLFIIF